MPKHQTQASRPAARKNSKFTKSAKFSKFAACSAEYKAALAAGDAIALSQTPAPALPPRFPIPEGLGVMGWGDPPGGMSEQYSEIALCYLWLIENTVPSPRPNYHRSANSYRLKHEVEDENPAMHINHGSLIAAAIALGYEYHRMDKYTTGDCAFALRRLKPKERALHAQVQRKRAQNALKRMDWLSDADWHRIHGRRS